MKFKIGDQVRVTKTSPLYEMYDINVGDVGTIKRMSDEEFYYVRFMKLVLVGDTYHVTPDGCIVMSEKRLEKVEEKKAIMTLNDLRSGMVVETRDCERYLVLVNGNDIHMMGSNGVYYMGNWEVRQLYHDDLTRKHNNTDQDIMKVYGRVTTFKAVNETKNLLWEREESTEMTVEEIEELLGYKIKVVADHE